MAVVAEGVAPAAPAAPRVHRHTGVDRLFHWLTAVAVLILLGTGLLPHVGVRFDWVAIHWITGLALVVLVIFHSVRASLWQRLRTIWFSLADLRARRSGKYSTAQKLMHHALTLVVLAAVVTGLLMLKKISTPLLLRDPYFLSPDTWGVVYFIHGLAAVCAVTLVMIHVYFGLLPENRAYLRAMVSGWTARAESDPGAAASAPRQSK
jgi:formate dehydrogenase subunit gamma